MKDTNKMLEELRKCLDNMSEEEKEKMCNFFKDTRPKGWLSIEDHLPHMYAMDIMEGYSVFKVRDKDGNEFDTKVSDHNTWYYGAREVGITHWLHE